MKNVAMLIDANARFRNRSSGTSGCGRRAIRIGKATSDTTPIAMAIQAAVSAHSLAWPRMTPNARPPTASAATAAPSQSNRPVDSVVARLLDVADGRPQREREQRDVDEERDPPAGRVDERAADDRAEHGQGRRGRRPDAEGPGARDAVEGVRDERERAGDEQRPGRPLDQAEDDQPFERRGEAAQGGGGGEPDEADGVDAAATVVVGQRAGEDEQGGQHREVAADDVGLALEHADERAGQLLPDVLERRVDDRAVEEDGTRSDDRRDERPALPCGHRGDGWSGAGGGRGHLGAVSHRLSAMPGPVALVGAGEFLPSMLEFDAGLLASSGRARPRVAILPTASYPDGEAVFTRWAAMGVAHFGALGAEVEPVLVRDREAADDPAAAQAIGEADLIYLSGGKPSYLMEVLDGSAVGRALADAHERGAVLVGCSAGAMVLAGHTFDLRLRLAPWPLRWRHGLGFAPGASVVPHYDAWPEPMSALIALQAPRGSLVLGIDEETALVGQDGAWQVHGRSRVTVWRGHRRERFRAGDTFRL